MRLPVRSRTSPMVFSRLAVLVALRRVDVADAGGERGLDEARLRRPSSSPCRGRVTFWPVLPRVTVGNVGAGGAPGPTSADASAAAPPAPPPS